jgi:predicted MPP superfamily phosphohydrolase
MERARRRPYSSEHLRMEKAMVLAYAGGWPAALWGMFPAAARVRLVEHALDRHRTGRPPLRIAFASDLHLGPTTPRVVLDKAFDLLRASRPDVLALGGDYVFLGATRERVRELTDRVDSVGAATKVAVLGNHDFWARPERLQDALAAAGVTVLMNQVLRLPPPHDDVALLGLDDPLTGDATLDPLVEATQDAAVRVVLCHSPDGYPAVKGRPVDLYLCGHTHGGHLCWPNHRPLWMPSRYGRIWPFGLHDVEGLQLFVSRGVGGSMVPMRWNAPPDVAVFTIT